MRSHHFHHPLVSPPLFRPGLKSCLYLFWLAYILYFFGFLMPTVFLAIVLFSTVACIVSVDFLIVIYTLRITSSCRIADISSADVIGKVELTSSQQWHNSSSSSSCSIIIVNEPRHSVAVTPAVTSIKWRQSKFTFGANDGGAEMMMMMMMNECTLTWRKS